MNTCFGRCFLLILIPTFVNVLMTLDFVSGDNVFNIHRVTPSPWGNVYIATFDKTGIPSPSCSNVLQL